jgi:transcriptional regulator with XRE-family HTH domain
METAEKIRLHRKIANLTQAELSERCGLSANHLSVYERGVRTAKLSTISRIAKGLGVNPLSLLPDWFIDDIVSYGERRE